MPITLTEMNWIGQLLFLKPGRVLDFDEQTFKRFFEPLGIDVDAAKYRVIGDQSITSRLQEILTTESDASVLRVLRQLSEHRQSILATPGETPVNLSFLMGKFSQIVTRLQQNVFAETADALGKFAESATIDQLIEAIQRDAKAERYEVAIDRLHTYCVKRFSDLLARNGINPDNYTTLDGLAGAYVNGVSKSGVRPVTGRILKGITKLMHEVNVARNKHSFAHDNPLVTPEEGRYIFDSVIAALRFLRANENLPFNPPKTKV